MTMNLNPGGSGDYSEYIKYNAKAGRWYIKGAEGMPEVEVERPKMAFDFAGVKTGWIAYPAGAGPVKYWDPPGGTADKPNVDKIKRGFEIMVWNSQIGWREFSSTAGAVINQVLIMEQQYELGMAQYPNQVPVFQCAGVNALTSKHGVNYEPLFELVSWIDRAKLPTSGAETQSPLLPPRNAGQGSGEYVEDDIPF